MFYGPIVLRKITQIFMKIVLLHYRLIRRGGLETRLLNYIEQFHRRGHQVSVVCAKWDKTIPLPPEVSVHRLNLGLMLKPFRAWYFAHKAKKRMAQLDYDFALSLGRTATQDAVLMPGGHRGYLRALAKKWRFVGDWMQIHLDEAAYAHSQMIFAASTMMADELREAYRVPPEKIRLLYPPLNLQQYNTELRPQRAALRQKLELAPEKTVFVFASSSHYRKGLDILLRVFAQLDPQRYELLIVGLPAVKSALPHVRYLGFWERLRELYTAADFMILPARYEPFGQVVAESLQCGTPVLLSSGVGARDVVGPKEGLIIDSLDPQRWVEAIREHPPSHFSVAPDFAQRQDLSIERHVEQMLDYWQNR